MIAILYRNVDTIWLVYIWFVQARLAEQQQRHEARMREKDHEIAQAMQRANQEFQTTMAQSMMTFQANLMKNLFDKDKWTACILLL